MRGNDRIVFFDDFKLTTSPLRLYRVDRPLDLSLQPLKLLELLIANRGKLVAHAAIRQHLWQGKRVEFGPSIHACVHQLRAALDDPAESPRYIENIPGQGYRFVAEVRTSAGQPVLRRKPLAVGLVMVIATMLFLGLAFAPRLQGPGDGGDVARVRDHHQRGLYLLQQRSPEAVRSALTHFDAALALDPEFAPANLAAARALERLGRFEEARLRARRAMEADGSAAGAHVALGRIALAYEWDWAAARDHFVVAIEMDPESAEAHQGLATHDILMGSFESGLTLMDRARELDPVSTLIRGDYGWFHYYAGNLEAAVQLCGEAAELASEVLAFRHCLVYALIEKGDTAAALPQVRASMEIQGASTEEIASVLEAYSKQGVVAYHRWRHRTFTTGGMRKPLSPTRAAFLCAAVGDVECALSELERAYLARDHLLPFVAVSPAFASLSADHRFQAILRKLGLRRYERVASSSSRQRRN